MSVERELGQELPAEILDEGIGTAKELTDVGNKKTKVSKPAANFSNQDGAVSSDDSSRYRKREPSPPFAHSVHEYSPAASPKGDRNSANGSEGNHQEPKEGEASIKFLLHVFTYNDRLGWLMNVIAFFCMIVSGTVLPLMDVVFGKFVNVFNDFATGSLSPAGYRSELNRYSLYFVYLFIGKFLLTYIWTVLINITSIRTVKELRIDFLRQMLRQEIPFFDRPSSSVSGQITTNGNLISNGISEKLGITVQGISTFVAAFVVAFAVHWKLTLIIISIVPVNLVVNIVCIGFDTVYEQKMFDIYSHSGALAEEAFSSIRTAHAFWAFPKLARKFNMILEDAAQIGAKKSLVYAILFPVEFFCIFAGYGLAFWQGIRMYSEGEIQNPGTVLTVIFAILVAAQALTQIAPQTIAISKATAAATDLFDVIDRKSVVDSLSVAGSKMPQFRGDIKLRKVRFAYPSRPDVKVLHGLDLDIPADRTTALVGASGSGKSTIFGLLERWYLPNDGEITLDDTPIDQLNLQWLRTNIRLVQQEPTLFSGSIYQNVVDGLTGTEMADLPEPEKKGLVINSCKAAFAHDFIESLPQGYETVIGERGASLSGGQKQRIVIARSIISNPKVLLLDEATSALDPTAEKIVQKALNNVAKGRTMVVIAHRLSTIRDADNIIVMSKGQTLEQGSHDQLLAQKGAYHKLVKAQDLGHGPSPVEEIEDEQQDTMQEWDRALTTRSSPGGEAIFAPASVDGEGLGLFQGVWRVLKEQRSIWPSMATIFICAVMGGATYPALAILFSKTMEAFQTVDVEKGNFFSLMFFIVAIGNFAAYGIAGWHANVVAQHVMRVYRGELFGNTMRQDMTFFDRPEHGAGALASRLSSEPTSLQELMSMNLALMLINVVNLLSSTILAIVYGWKLGLVLGLGALPALVGPGYVRIRLEFKFDDDTAKRFARSSALASEAVLAIRTVSSLALENAIVARYRASLENIAKNSIGGLGWKMAFYSLSQSISFLAMGLGFWYGGRLVSTGEYTNAQFYVVFIAIIFSGESAATFFQYTTSITKARTAMNYIFTLRRRRALSDPKYDAADPDQEAAAGEKERENDEKGMAVNFSGVGFSYPLRPGLKVLQDIDITIPPGKMVAFVGASGCGKSTMIGLLERFYDPTTGAIHVNGQDIQALHRRAYRRDVALVQQEPVLYQGSIRDNIALGIEDDIDQSSTAGNHKNDDAAIIEACREANIWNFVASLPEGLDTPCGNQGLALSGGQRQRIAIARALIRSPRLLLLDEATSALDTESERVVQAALDRAAAGRTTVAVAHRLSTIRGADAIIVVDRGRVAQVGTHDELVARRGLYYNMVLGQSLDREAA